MWKCGAERTDMDVTPYEHETIMPFGYVKYNIAFDKLGMRIFNDASLALTLSLSKGGAHPRLSQKSFVGE